MPKISIIIPVHNGADDLENAVASIAGQTERDVELIIVNDASTDSTPQLMKSFASRYPDLDIVCMDSEGRGLSDTRNTGIRRASGEYIAFLDDDDEYLPDGLATLLRLLENSPDSDIAVGQFESVRALPLSKTQSPASVIEATLYQEAGYQSSACAKLYRRSLFDEDTMFASKHWYEDLEFFPRIYAKARGIIVTGRRVYNYKRHSGSFIHTWSEARMDALWAVDSIAARLGNDMSGAVRSRRFSAYFNIFNLALANNRPDIARQCWTELKKMRLAVLRDNRVRPKNRIASIVSFLGFRMTGHISKLTHIQ